jgi:hypothetical protein
MGDNNKALEFFQKSLAILIKNFGEDHADVALSYIRIGKTYSFISDFKMELEFNQKSLAIRIKLFGENHKNVR